MPSRPSRIGFHVQGDPGERIGGFSLLGLQTRRLFASAGSAARGSFIGGTGRAGAPRNFMKSVADNWRWRQFAVELALQKSLARYRTMVLGPLWMAIAFCVSSVGLAFLFAMLLNRPFEEYLPYLVTGLFIWNLIFGAVSEGPRILLDYRSLILQGQIPIAIYPLISNLKQWIVMMHGLPVLLVVLAITPNTLSPQLLWLVPGLLAITIFCISISLILAIAGAYFPDLAEVVSSGMRFVFFLTPVLWMADQRPTLIIISHANPLFYFLEAFRAPIIGTSDPGFAVMVASIIATVTAIIAVIVARKFSLGSIVRI